MYGPMRVKHDGKMTFVWHLFKIPNRRLVYYSCWCQMHYIGWTLRHTFILNVKLGPKAIKLGQAPFWSKSHFLKGIYSVKVRLRVEPRSNVSSSKFYGLGAWLYRHVAADL